MNPKPEWNGTGIEFSSICMLLIIRSVHITRIIYHNFGYLVVANILFIDFSYFHFPLSPICTTYHDYHEWLISITNLITPLITHIKWFNLKCFQKSLNTTIIFQPLNYIFPYIHHSHNVSILLALFFIKKSISSQKDNFNKLSRIYKYNRIIQFIPRCSTSPHHIK